MLEVQEICFNDIWTYSCLDTIRCMLIIFLFAKTLDGLFFWILLFVVYKFR